MNPNDKKCSKSNKKSLANELFLNDTHLNEYRHIEKKEYFVWIKIICHWIYSTKASQNTLKQTIKRIIGTTESKITIYNHIV